MSRDHPFKGPVMLMCDQNLDLSRVSLISWSDLEPNSDAHPPTSRGGDFSHKNNQIRKMQQKSRQQIQNTVPY